jgi:hypothetical protein
MVNDIYHGSEPRQLFEPGLKPEADSKPLLNQALDFLKQHGFSITPDQSERVANIVGGGEPGNVIKSGHWQIEAVATGFLVTMDTEKGKEDHLFK